MLTVKQAAQKMGVCEAIVYACCANGSLPHYRIGRKRGKILISEADIEAFLQQNRVEKKEPEPVKAPAVHYKPKHLKLT